ncbi:hypothetical protein [Reyranella sp.]|uniref:hypothetical protein n=1 Tax=Reyranella sp. TaxID=1929291 RepID=UPI003D0C8D29
MRVTIPYLVEKTNRDGTKRYYWQPSAKLAKAGWPTVALPPDPRLAAEQAQRENAKLRDWYQQGRPRLRTSAGDVEPDGAVVRGSVRELVNLYRRPPAGVLADPEADRERRRDGIVYGYDYATLKAKTKTSYDSCLDYIAAWLGPLPVRKVDESIVLERLKAIAAQVHEKGPNKGRRKIATANLIGRVGRMLWHASRTLVPPSHPCYVPKASNPWAGLRARERRQVPVLWTKEARDLVIDAARKLDWISIATAIRIEWWIGQREADILALPQNLDPAALLQVTQGKTAGEVRLPVGMVPEIAEAIAELRADQKARGLAGIKLLIDERNGLLWDEHRFRKAFQVIRACAVEEALWAIRTRQPGWEGRTEAWVDRHLAGLTFMRLRHTVVTMLYRAGATIPEVAAITGHTIGSVSGIIEKYGLRDEETAGNAIQKRLDREGA